MNAHLLLNQLRDLDEHLANDRHADGSVLCHSLIDEILPASVYAVLSQAAQRLGDFDAMLLAAHKSAVANPDDFAPRLRLAECYLYAGYTDRCLAELGKLEQLARNDGATLQLVGNLYTHCNAHIQAARCFERAVAIAPEHIPYRYNLGTSHIALGHLDRAQAMFDSVIAQQPSDFGAYLNRSMLRTATGESNHIDELGSQLAKVRPGHAGEVPLCYALGKELEDLGEADAAFHMFARGARTRRQHLSYSVDKEADTIDSIRAAFDSRVLERARAPGAPGAHDLVPTFVVGLPRSGTTLVERILSSHSAVGSVGEVNNLAFAVMRMAAGPGGKHGMIKRAACGDMDQLRQIYLRGIAGYGVERRYLINKTPENFLYLGLIALSMPEARIVHLRRHPLDSCFAMYKTLFRMGYPYSYSLEDLGKYYVAYHRLMQHWRERIPERFIDIAYEDMVADQQGMTRRLLSHCGLDWEDACLEFHRNAAPSATASAAQVRRPIYNSSVARWRRYATHLEPLAQYLTAHGIDCN